MTSPYAFYQYWVNVEDASVGDLLRVFTDRTRDEIEVLEKAVRDRPQAREAQRTLAMDVTTLVHGPAAAEAAVVASGALFGRGELGGVDEQPCGRPCWRRVCIRLRVSCRPLWDCSSRRVSHARCPRRVGRWPRAGLTSTTCGSAIPSTTGSPGGSAARQVPGGPQG